MKITKILYWLFFAVGCGFFILNLFIQNTAIMFISLAFLILAVIFYFVNANIRKKQENVPAEDQRNAELKKQREDSYKRIRESKKAKKDKNK